MKYILRYVGSITYRNVKRRVNRKRSEYLIILSLSIRIYINAKRIKVYIMKTSKSIQTYFQFLHEQQAVLEL